MARREQTGLERYITCPSCGTQKLERCDYPRSLRLDGDQTTMECNNEECDLKEPFEVWLHVDYRYQTRTLED